MFHVTKVRIKIFIVAGNNSLQDELKIEAIIRYSTIACSAHLIYNLSFFFIFCIIQNWKNIQNQYREHDKPHSLVERKKLFSAHQSRIQTLKY